jgi:transposase-like protein
MDCLTSEQVLSALRSAQWTAEEVAQLQEWVAGMRHSGECLALIEAAAQGRGCPRCGCKRVHRCGHASNLQRFRCLDCRRSYNALTGTPLARLRKRGHWLTYLQCVLESRTVRDAAQVTGVHRTTSFRWRHRFVPGAARDRPACLSGVVEADETYLLESQKGSRHMTRPARHRGGVATHRGIGRAHDCLLIAQDRNGNTLDFHTGRGPLTAVQLKASIGPALAADALLVSDGAASYRRFAQDAGIRHAGVNEGVSEGVSEWSKEWSNESGNTCAGMRKPGDIGLQNVHGWHARLKGWLVRFRGVASRYLIHYSGWQRILDTGCLTTPAQLLEVAVRLNR